VLDPHLDRMVGTLTGPRRPTFVVVRMAWDPWSQDPQGRVPDAVASGYRQVAVVCHDLILARLDVTRTGPRFASCR
jgi:hypothetical protein